MSQTQAVGHSDRIDAGLLPGFLPFSALWEGTEAPFPSEQSARWAYRHSGKRWAAQGILALHRNRLLVDIPALRDLLKREAIEAMQRRAQVSA